jgi:hypothetical protein
MIRRTIAAFGIALAACAPSSHVLVGPARPPISPADVKVYLQPPPSFQQIAIVNASADSALSTGGQASVNKVIARLKDEAAKLGANGIILEGMSDRQTGSIGAGSGSSSYSGNSAVGVGVGGSLGIFKKTGEGRAIYVPPGAEPPAPAPPAIPAAPAAPAPPPAAEPPPTTATQSPQ